MNKKKRAELSGFIGKLTNAPSIYKQTVEYNDIPLYFREFFEETATFFKAVFVESLSKQLEIAAEWVQKQLSSPFTDKENSQKVFGVILQAVFFIIFIYADIIVVFATLQIRGIVQEIPQGFRDYGLAVTAGSLLSAIVGAFVLHEIFGRGDFSNWDRVKGTVWETVAKWLAFILLITGIIAVIGLGLARFDRLLQGETNTSQFYQGFGDFIITVLVFLNSTLAAILIGADAFIGIKILLLILAWMLLVIFRILHLLLVTIAIGLLLQLFDIINRVLLAAGKILLFILETPVQTVLEPITDRKKPSPTDSKVAPQG